jgi:hypothetical protein
MIRVHIDQHTEECLNNDIDVDLGFWMPSYNSHKMCKANYIDFIVLFNCDFHHVTIPKCLIPSYLSYPDQRLFLIENLFADMIKKEKWQVYKSVKIDDHLKAAMNDSASLGELTTEVNFIYQNNAGKEFAIVTEKPKIDAILQSEQLRENYYIAQKYLIQNNKKEHLPLIKELYLLNVYYELKPALIFKTIEEFSKQLTYNEHANDKKSKQQRTSKARI